MDTNQNSSRYHILFKKLIFVIVIFMIIVFGLYVFLFGVVRIYHGRVWVVASECVTQHGTIFVVDSHETAIFLSQKSFVFNMSPEVTVRFYQGSISRFIEMDDENRVVTVLPAVQGIIEVKGSFYRTYTTTGSDVIPEFTRQELYERLQSEVMKLLPEDKSVVIGEHFKNILNEYDKVCQTKIISQDDRLRSKCSHIFGYNCSCPTPFLLRQKTDSNGKTDQK